MAAAAVLRSLGDTEHGGLLPALVDAFAARAPGLVLAMRGAAMDGDRQQLRAHVQLAGAAANIGAVAAAALARSIEHDAAAGTGGTPGAAIPWDRLDAEVGDAVRLLTQALPAAT